jgi:hypothetical protein
MSNINDRRPGSQPSPDGFSWNVRISERALIAVCLIVPSFASGYVCSRVTTPYQKCEAALVGASMAVPSSENPVSKVKCFPVVTGTDQRK